jgi:hypothetical protein
MRDLPDARPADQQCAARAERDQHDGGTGGSESGAQRRTDRATDEPAGVLQRFVGAVGILVPCELKAADDRRAQQDESDGQPQTPARRLLVVFVLPLLGPEPCERADRAEGQRERDQDLAPAQHLGRRGVDAFPDRADDIGNDREEAQQPDDDQPYGDHVAPDGRRAARKRSSRQAARVRTSFRVAMTASDQAIFAWGSPAAG